MALPNRNQNSQLQGNLPPASSVPYTSHGPAPGMPAPSSYRNANHEAVLQDYRMSGQGLHVPAGDMNPASVPHPLGGRALPSQGAPNYRTTAGGKLPVTSPSSATGAPHGSGVLPSAMLSHSASSFTSLNDNRGKAYLAQPRQDVSNYLPSPNIPQPNTMGRFQQPGSNLALNSELKANHDYSQSENLPIQNVNVSERKPQLVNGELEDSQYTSASAKRVQTNYQLKSDGSQPNIYPGSSRGGPLQVGLAGQGTRYPAESTPGRSLGAQGSESLRTHASAPMLASPGFGQVVSPAGSSFRPQVSSPSRFPQVSPVNRSQQRGASPSPLNTYQQIPGPARPGQRLQHTTAPANEGGHNYKRRYPLQENVQHRSQAGGDMVTQGMAGLSVAQGFNKLWGMETIELLQNRNILPPEKLEAPLIKLYDEYLSSVNCSPDIFRCTLTKIPQNNSLLQKSRLPLGILIHPFKDLNHLPVIQCSTIVRCQACRTYINPFIHFVDQKHWKCNLCFKVNELPEEFQYDPVSNTHGDPSKRPEIRSSTIEFIAPSEYMLRPPQPAVYLFLLDVSQMAVESGYLATFTKCLVDNLDKLPGDGRTQVGFIAYNSNVHFYNLAEGLSQPQQMVIVDIDDVFVPCPDNLLVNLSECVELVKDLLAQLPAMFAGSHDSKSALGAALQAAYKLMAPTGGRITVFQSCLPNVGPGALSVREDPSLRAGKEAHHLNPATDFYKRLALDCSGQQIAVDLFLVNSQYADLATLLGISRFSGGCIYHFPLFKASNAPQNESFHRTLKRYLTRKIGFEAVMRIRCSRGLSIHTFHGNFFVRSTDLLSLPNVNPDAGFGMQIAIEDSLTDLQTVCFQAAVLYTSSKGERRIRVHTLCLPIGNTLSDVLYSADQQCIVGLLGKMAVDRSHQSSLVDARDAFINVAIDVLSAYKLVVNSGPSGDLLAPNNLCLLPLYILALLKCVAFRTGQSTRLDDRLFAMCQMKTLPLGQLIQTIYPDLYPVHNLDDQNVKYVNGVPVPNPPRLHLSAEKLDSTGAFLLDAVDVMIIYVGHSISAEFCSAVFGVPDFCSLPDEMYKLPEIPNAESQRLQKFVNHLQSEKPCDASLHIMRDDSHNRRNFFDRLIEDRSETSLTYYEFLQHLKANVK
ncbi:protein transport protein Sec24A [Bacillus rossius redtenbacheri]|uniref:protein transport protein Sec24A n=1 Tax=Bacillus rossius redtenbacheri TaxID=93214 RepID=UPI002FDE440C